MIELLNMDCMEYMAALPDKAFDLAIGEHLMEPDQIDMMSGADLRKEFRKIVKSNVAMREAIIKVLADPESGSGGWGPDVTMCSCLRASLFKGWFNEASAIHALRYGMPLDEQTKPDWKEYFDEGFSPADAIDEDALHG